MAPEPRYRQILSELLKAVQEDSSEVVRGEINVRRNLRSSSRAHASVLDARLHNVKRDLDLLQTAAECLRDQQTVLRRLKACAQNAAQPVYSIPDEVLASVFGYGTPVVSSLWDVAPPTSDVATWSRSQFNQQRSSIGATCSHFRDILLTTPRCWSDVSCVIDAGERGNTSLVALKVWLARSRNCQFDLRVSILMHQERTPSVSDLDAVSRILLPHMHRCRSLQFASNYLGAEFLLLIPQSALEILSHAEFDWRASGDWQEPVPRDTTKVDASMLSMMAATRVPLQSLVLACVDSHIDLKTIEIQDLTRLKIDLHSTRVVLQLLQHCTALEHLDWTVHDTGENLNEFPHQIDLSSLVSLRVTGEHPHKSCILNAPRLEQIRFHSDDVSALPFDIVRDDHPTLQSLDRVQITNSYNPALPKFLRRHRHISQCLLFVDNLTDNSDVMRIRDVLESLLSDGQSSSMRYFLLWFGRVDALMWERVKSTVELVLGELPELHIALNLGHCIGRQPESFCAEFGSRISIEKHPHLNNMWRDAWGIVRLSEW